MTSLYWHTCGEGKRDLVLLHGWGLNAEVWQSIIPRLSAHYRLHLVDLPGYGRSQHFGALTLEQMAAQLLPALPPQAIVVGWSLGGLVATQLALSAPEKLAALITVASSPCFTATESWPGIKPETLQNFQQMLSNDFQRTVERFLALQTLGTETARADARQLKEVVLSQADAGGGGAGWRTGYSAPGRSARRVTADYAAVPATLWRVRWTGAAPDCGGDR
ncbi:Pimelyl-[acyl-carrier protein] methyl ester esterase [Pantoea agglomerans]|uniref:Pimelyl-[acyl-carrier protein] methyl ester esterase n=1 Tax=Enterobacter agglomerans TaxID=549 RepID=A0A379A9S1_ENTAG|nr:Pimelyl-[acyl-carrier protein] methyl ester esterase [Pantoea agglomerans]